MEVVNEMETMNGQLIALGLAILAVLSFAAFISYLNMRGIYSAARKVLRLRSTRAGVRSVREVSRCS
jgi:hypothetical protein